MDGRALSNVLRSSSVALTGPHTIVTFVLPSTSSNVVVESISMGQLGLNGCRVNPPLASENELTSSSFLGGSICRNTHFPHISFPSPVFMQ